MAQKIFEERYEVVQNRKSGMQKATEHASKFAFYDESTVLETLALSVCDVTILPMSEPYPLGWIYKKDFKHREVFDHM